MRIPEELVALVKESEGFHRVVRLSPVPTAVPYICPAGYWTIGYGELCQPSHPEMTEPEGAHRLQAVLLPAYVAHALRLSPVLLTASDARLTAVADFIFNLGPTRYASSTFRRRVGALDWQEAAGECRRWVWGGGKKLPGLVLRREREAVLLLRG